MSEASAAAATPLPPRRIGVLLVNLGTPDATDYWSMRRYLKEFLSDRRVIEENRAQMVAGPQPHHPDRAARPQGPRLRQDLEQGAQRVPLKTITRSQAEKLAASLAGDRASGRLGDALRQSVDRLAARRAAAAGCDRILIVPLYPQYAAATTATVCDKAFARSPHMRWQPALRVAPPWYDEPVYIDALADSLQAGAGEARVQARRDPRLLPRHAGGLSRQRRSLYCHCAETARLLRKKLGLDESS